MKKNYLHQTWQANKSLIIFIVLMSVFRSAIADWNDVPTGSMKPTIVEGDRIFINKLAYDIKVPFINQSLIALDDPKVNDIVIFESKVAEKRLVKRVIGEPGDIVAMNNNQLIINGNAVTYQVVNKQNNQTIYLESINGQTHKIQLTQQESDLRNFAPVKVPQDHYLVLGDNRNNSADSRVIGFVPREEIIGRSQNVVFSLNYDNYLLPRSERFFRTL
ncbi:signal peptidase I [Thalassotalea insulae]|uniref:Signal peptidase I n=1 Tax=Thalassotalea insulae TaxID=2056778 RepID=A0ABQ6GRE3_9GAMM|nr:signal peptidase I [Thalassotalea insulae]GLX77177.1 signal peptidase I [Thalassotalea insulae]